MSYFSILSSWQFEHFSGNLMWLKCELQLFPAKAYVTHYVTLTHATLATFCSWYKNTSCTQMPVGFEFSSMYISKHRLLQNIFYICIKKKQLVWRWPKNSTFLKSFLTVFNYRYFLWRIEKQTVSIKWIKYIKKVFNDDNDDDNNKRVRKKSW